MVKPNFGQLDAEENLTPYPFDRLHFQYIVSGTHRERERRGCRWYRTLKEHFSSPAAATERIHGHGHIRKNLCVLLFVILIVIVVVDGEMIGACCVSTTYGSLFAQSCDINLMAKNPVSQSAKHCIYVPGRYRRRPSWRSVLFQVCHRVPPAFDALQSNVRRVDVWNFFFCWGERAGWLLLFGWS